MSIKYLYLDDEQEQQTIQIAELLTAEAPDLEIELDKPKSFAEEIKRLKAGNYDGLIFDLRLDVKSDAEYRAFTLAQELRTRATEGGMKDIPIVVCSTDVKLKKSYNKDGTGHDLFDRKYLKDEDLVDRSEMVALELLALAKGYKQIAEIKSQKGGRGAQLKRMFALDSEALELLDVRLIDHFGEVEGRLPAHEYARFLMKEMLQTSGPLVDINMLAARLGVGTSSPNLQQLLGKLSKFKYKGPFHQHWERWWWHLIEQWWLSKNTTHLSFLDAEERIEQIKKMTKLSDLQTAEPIDASYSSKFWTVCALYQKPLDLLDSVMVETKDEPLPWQDVSYMSLKAALDIESKANNIFPHQLEKQRIKDIQKTTDE